MGLDDLTEPVTKIEFVTVYMDENGGRQERPIGMGRLDPGSVDDDV